MRPPEDEDTFVHRSGRTGRAGRSGTNVVLYGGPSGEQELMRLEKSVGIQFALEALPYQHPQLSVRTCAVLR